jgi:hypothetical protein
MDINTYRNYLLLGKVFWLAIEVRLSEEDYARIFKNFKLLEKFVPSSNHYGLLMERKAQL